MAEITLETFYTLVAKLTKYVMEEFPVVQKMPNQMAEKADKAIPDGRKNQLDQKMSHYDQILDSLNCAINREAFHVSYNKQSIHQPDQQDQKFDYLIRQHSQSEQRFRRHVEKLERLECKTELALEKMAVIRQNLAIERKELADFLNRLAGYNDRISALEEIVFGSHIGNVEEHARRKIV